MTDRVANRVVATGHPGRRRHPSTVVLGLVLAGAVVVPACSSGDPSADPSTSPPASTSTAPPTTATSVPTTTSRYVWTPEQTPIVDTYVAFDKAYHDTAASPDPDFTALARYSSGDLLMANKILISQHRRDGYRTRPGPNHLARAIPYRVAFRDGKGYVDVCLVDDFVVYRASDGDIINNDVGTRRVGAQIEAVDGPLKVTGQETQQEWPGEEMDACLRD